VTAQNSTHPLELLAEVRCLLAASAERPDAQVYEQTGAVEHRNVLPVSRYEVHELVRRIDEALTGVEHAYGRDDVVALVARMPEGTIRELLVDVLAARGATP
jgi:hypothetical protein